MEIKDNVVVEALPLDIDPDSKEVLVTVAPALCKKLKPHQARGKFIHKIVEKAKHNSFNLARLARFHSIAQCPRAKCFFFNLALTGKYAN